MPAVCAKRWRTYERRNASSGRQSMRKYRRTRQLWKLAEAMWHKFSAEARDSDWRSSFVLLWIRHADMQRLSDVEVLRKSRGSEAYLGAVLGPKMALDRPRQAQDKPKTNPGQPKTGPGQPKTGPKPVQIRLQDKLLFWSGQPLPPTKISLP